MPQYRYPSFTTLADKIYGLFHVKDALKVMKRQFGKFGDTYALENKLMTDKFIFTKKPELIDHFMRKNHRNYEKSYIQSELLRKYLGNGLLTNTGESWKKQRRLIQPGFSHKRIEALQAIMLQEISAAIDNIPLNQPINLYETFNKMAFDVIAKSLFSSNISRKDIDLIAEVLTKGQEYFIKELRNPIYKFTLNKSGLIDKLLLRFQEVRKILQHLIDQRRNSGERRDDVLDLLLEVRYEDSGKAMADEQLIDELLILFIAGHETSANALSFTFNLLGNNSYELQKIRAEIEELGEKVFETETLFRPQSAIQNAIKESMRLYPPAWILDRQALEDDQFEGFSWEKGTILVGVTFAMNRNEGVWKNATQFLPDRFNEPDIKDKAFIPFGSGPRFCIGEHFAMMEMILCIRYFFSKYDFIPASDNLKLIAFVSLRPKEVMGKVVQKV